MVSRRICLVLVGAALLGTFQMTYGATVTVLKEGADLTTGGALDATYFSSVGPGNVAPQTVNDTYMTGNPAAAYVIFGNDTNSVATLLFKFDVSAIGPGAKIYSAQLRLRATNGNTSMSLARIVTHDWLETTACLAGPNAPPSPTKTWGPASDSYFSAADYATPVNFESAPSAAAWCVKDVTADVQAFIDNVQPNYGWYVGSGNHGIQMSEHATDGERPALFIAWDPNGQPAAVTNLASTGKDWFEVDLQWTAPTDLPPGPVNRYELRYSTDPIDDGNFASATLATAPTPASPGTVQTATVSGLAANTTYYFAIKSFDITNWASPLSNVISETTNPLDVVPPAQVSLQVAPADVYPNHVIVRWTAVGDDGVTGLASGYDLRYSTSPIVDDTTFDAATAVPGVPAPQTPGSAESFTVHGLTPSTTYYVAIKACDEVPNWSTLSSPVSFTTDPVDLDPPQAVADLHVDTMHIHAAYLSCTVPADVGSAGLAGYDIRYSTDPIDDGNWASATQVTNEPDPAGTGTTQLFAVTGLDPSTTYYFAMKSFDWAEPANVSALSNVVSGTTMPPIVPVTVHNPWIVNDRVADTHNITTIGATYVNAYTPDGVVAPTSDEAKAINIYNNQKRRLYHWADEPPAVGGNAISDPTYNQNVFGWSLCGRHADQACTIANAAGLGQRKIGLPGHWIYEVRYADSTYHTYDTMTTMYVYNKASPASVASCAQMKADSTLLNNAVADGRACPGFLLCGDSVSWYQDAVSSWSDGGSGVVTTHWTGNMDLRLGQSFKRTWEAWQNEHPTPRTNADSMPGLDPPYHHECQNDWKDYVNYNYWEPYGVIISYIHTGKATYRRWSNGTDTLAPDFTSAGYQSMLESGSTNLATYNDDQLSPDLHTNTVGTQGEAIFKISVPYYITDANVSGDFVKTNATDVCKLYFSSNGTSWTQVYDAPVGTTQLTNLNLRANVFALWQTWYVKVQMKATTAKTDAGVSNLVVQTIYEHNKGAMPYLDKGLNHLTLTFDNAAELQASRNVLHVVYKWKEYDGSGWNVDRDYQGYFVASPSTFTIDVAGSKVPRTEYILMEVIAPIVDLVPPGQVTDLATGATGACRVPLTWTATGDDGASGTAMAYDLRYSASPITDDTSFDAAAQVTGVPAPKISGSAESFTVMGLNPTTTYYFAMKVIDKGNNRGPLSNSAGPATTTALLPVSDLAAGTSTCSVVPLTWTAIDDGNVGKETSYDLRYSTSPITDGNFAAATQVAGVPAPKAAGQAESFSVRGLLGSTTYYFAIKGIDAYGHASPLSNVASTTTAVTPHVSDLAGTPGSNKVWLTWTAINDGDLGKMSSYDLRYSTSAITDDGSFNAATQVAGVPAPDTAGSAESFIVTGLSSTTTYYFAIKGVDSFGHASPLSNVPVVTTTEADVVPPNWIGDLKGVPSGISGGVDLTWTAPADYGYGGSGPFTCVSYELRYSTSPILYDDGGASWSAATVVSGLPAPKTPGSAETFTVSGLTGGNTYYFALKSTDDSNNVSEVSNSAPGVASVMGDLTLQKGVSGYNGCLDSYIDYTSTNWGSSERMTICGWADQGIANVQRGIITFDVSSLAGKSVTRATLSLFSYNDSQRKGSTGFYGAYKVTSDWTYNQCNWTLAKTGVPWITGGGDFLASPDATAPKQGVAQVWYSFDVTARVQAWIADGSDNYGWLIKCTDENLHNQDWLYQSDTSNAAYRPKLVVSDLPAPVAGDINGDGAVDVADLLILAYSFGGVRGQDRIYDPRADLNGDGVVDVSDLLILAMHWPP
jgi:hypothetical protein